MLKIGTLERTSLKTQQKIIKDAKERVRKQKIEEAEKAEKYFPYLSEHMQKLLKESYRWCYGGNYKEEIEK